MYKPFLFESQFGLEVPASLEIHDLTRTALCELCLP